ncbi:MAG TPA: hypothetical protein VGK17_10055 [Propionicimonas sp.]
MTATYGDLVGQAGADLHVGMIQVMRRRAHDEHHAANLVGAYYDLLVALRKHTWALVDPLRARTEDLLAAADGHLDGDVDVAAVRVFGAMQPINPRRASLPYPDAGFEHPWLDAAEKLGAASDLLATHLSWRGQPLSEHADAVMNVTNRRAALMWVAELTSTALSLELPLGAACRQAGVDWLTVHNWLPNLDHLQPLVTRMRDLAATYRAGRGLADVPLNTHPIRTGEPLVELTDRMLRLRHAAWTLTSRPDYSVVTLHDLAGLGMQIHLHTAAAHGIDLTRATDGGSPQVTAALTYRDLAGQLHRYLAPGPPDPAIRNDVLAARQLLLDAAPPSRIGRLTRLGDRLARESLSGLHSACDVMSQIAQMNRATFATLARSGHVQTPARLVRGDELSEDVIRAQQKLDGARTLIATPQQVKATLETYDRLVAVVPASRPYQPPITRAANYAHPALIRKEEFA